MGKNPGMCAKGNHQTMGSLNKEGSMADGDRKKGELVLRKPQELIPARHADLPPRERKLIEKARLSAFIAGGRLLQFAAQHGH